MLDCLDQCGTGLRVRQFLSRRLMIVLKHWGPMVIALVFQPAWQVDQRFSASKLRGATTLSTPRRTSTLRSSLLEQYAAGDFERLQCVLNARRTGAVVQRLSVGAEVEPANADCVAFCERRAMCDESYDVFLCQRECTPPGDDFDLRNRCEQIVECEDRALCDVGDGMIPEVCIAQCAAQANCEGIIGEGMDALYVSEEACQIDCAANGLRSGGETLDSLAACMEGIECDPETFAGCIIGRPPVDCGAGWDAIVACNNQLFLQLFGMINGRADYIRVQRSSTQSTPCRSKQTSHV